MKQFLGENFVLSYALHCITLQCRFIRVTRQVACEDNGLPQGFQPLCIQSVLRSLLCKAYKDFCFPALRR